eukprot:3884133-Rhodomonas_salina.1
MTALRMLSQPEALQQYLKGTVQEVDPTGEGGLGKADSGHNLREKGPQLEGERRVKGLARSSDVLSTIIATALTPLTVPAEPFCTLSSSLAKARPSPGYGRDLWPGSLGYGIYGGGRDLGDLMGGILGIGGRCPPILPDDHLWGQDISGCL